MWIMTPFGFYSAVQKHGTDFITIRARVGGDLTLLKEKYMPELSAEKAGGGTDYQYRATISKEAFAEGMKKLALDVNYDNFKSETARVSGYPRANVYHDIWDVHFDMERKIKGATSKLKR
jgi:hypothetical protein